MVGDTFNERWWEMNVYESRANVVATMQQYN